MNALEKFLPGEKIQTDANVLIVDFGDGEVVINRVKNDGELCRLDFQQDKYKCMQVLVGGNNIGSLTLWEKNKRPAADSYTYCHYKVHPDDADSPSIVWHEGTNKPSPSVTYGDLMARAFCNLMVQTLRNPNNRQSLGKGWDDSKPTYVFVGRPSAKEWTNSELEYQRILMEYEKYLSDHAKTPQEEEWFNQGIIATFGDNAIEEKDKILKKNDLRILVISEADAAYAECVCKPSKGKALPDNAYAIVCDMGSSTADIIVIYRKRLIIKDSIQLGGGDLDDCIFQCLDIDSDSAADPLLPIKVRKAKEAFFEDEEAPFGDEDRVADLILRGSGRNKRKRIEITEDIISAALYQTPIKKYVSGEETKLIYDSWKQGICDFLEKVKKQIDEKLPECVECHLYMTGGVSNMTECRLWAEEIFGVKSEIPASVPSPSYVIGEGLAYIARTELKKEEARATIMDAVHNLLTKKGSAFKNNIRHQLGIRYADAYVEAATYYRDKLTTVSFTFDEFITQQVPKAMNPEDANLKNIKQFIFLNDYKSSYWSYVLDSIRKWFETEDIKTLISNTVKNGLHSLFPDSEIFDFQLDIEQSMTCFKGTPLYWMPANIHTLRLFGNLPFRKNKTYKKEFFVNFFKAKYNEVVNTLAGLELKGNEKFIESITNTYDALTSQIEEQIDRFIDAITPYRLI